MEGAGFRIFKPRADWNVTAKPTPPRPSTNKVFKMTEGLLITFYGQEGDSQEAKKLFPHRQLTFPSSPLYKGSMTNKENRFLAHVGQVLTNDADPKKIKEYQIEEFLGKGAYASVFLVKSLKNGKPYAAKILKNDPEAINHCAKHEKKILLELNKAEKNIQKQVIAEDIGIKSGQSSRIVILKDFFIIHQEKPVPVAHFVLIFEKLELSLYNLLESTGFHGLTLCMIQRFAYFALEGLQLMKSRRITHSDIKPENIMLVDKNDYQLKIVDFGLARRDCDYEGFYIQSRYYRAPEVILGLKFTEAIDMWSLGCTLAELYLGIPIFHGNCNLNMLIIMHRVLGPISKDLIENSPFAKYFFTRLNDNEYQLMTPEEHEQVTGQKLEPQENCHDLNRLQELNDLYYDSDNRKYSHNFGRQA